MQPVEVVEELLVDNFLVDGVLISGGEPTLHKDVVDLCYELVRRGMRVVINTNGSHPEIIMKLPDSVKITMDLKVPMERYEAFAGFPVVDAIEKSMGMLRAQDEIRITWSPSLLSETDLEKMIRWKESVNKKTSIYLQGYQWHAKGGLPKLAVPTKEQAKEMAKKFNLKMR